MAAKSVIEIDIADQKWQRFQELFDKYQKSLAATPSMWKQATKESQGLADQFERVAAALLAQNETARELKNEDEDKLKRLTTTEKLWTSIGKTSSVFAKNILDVGAGILKWGGLLAGGALFGSLWGLDRLGAGAAGQRRSSTGLGLSVGEQQAFGTSLGRFVDTNAFLSGIGNATSNVALQGPLYGIGVNPNQSTANVAVDTLKAVRSLALGTPVNQLGILESSRHLDQLGISTEDLRRLKSASPDEFNKQLSHYKSDVGALGFGDKTGEAWQSFTDQMHRAGQEIFKVFVEKLAPLAGPLTKLSDAVVHVIERFANGGAIATAIDEMAKYLDNFSGTIAKPEFLQKVQTFASDVGLLGDAVHAAVHPFETAGSKVADYVEGKVDAYRHEGFEKVISDQAAQFGVPKELLDAQWMLESHQGSYGGLTSSKGAKGVFQIMPNTAKELGIDPTDNVEAAYGAAKYDAKLLKKYHNDISAVLASYNMGQGNFDKVRSAHPNDWINYVSAETKDYVKRGTQMVGAPGVLIQINNNTGGNAVVSASQLTQ
jgi:Transglycosylase SLT domain